ncbi:PilZ domain-containing protein [Desulfuromonas sp. TF]|uniref:PilZ domain-containing protein n=1 Tax=Desulfuromonas sp. TF TaxID=1232410 RepID=UPI000402A777|nr:PilZ domain-containing protein [Desulfuromonas sp. TF]
MLIGTLPKPSENRLCLFVRNESFRLVLAGLLGEWRYSVQKNPAAADLLLAEDGSPVPEDGAPVLWLTRTRCEEQDRLGLPFSLEELWTELERRFYKPARSRIRIRLALPATLEVRNETVEISITSLSDLGGRFDLDRELAPGEELVLGLTIARRRLKLSARVIYVVPLGDLDRSGKAQIGVIFDYRARSLRKVLHDFVIQTYLERVRAGMDAPVFMEGLSHFDVPPAILKEIGFPKPCL